MEKENTYQKTQKIIVVFMSIMLIVTLFFAVHEVIQRGKKIDNLKMFVKACENNKENFSVDEYEFTNQKKLREDIYSYIKNRYTRIPKEVAISISDNIVLFSKQYDMSPGLLVGMMEIESRFNPMAVSSADARGLMQVMPEWVPKLGIKNVNDLHDIDVGIEAGIKVFNIHLEEAKGNVSKALYLYVGKNSEYAKEVYSFVGRFVIYKAKKQKVKIKDGTNK